MLQCCRAYFRLEFFSVIFLPLSFFFALFMPLSLYLSQSNYKDCVVYSLDHCLNSSFYNNGRILPPTELFDFHLEELLFTLIYPDTSEINIFVSITIIHILAKQKLHAFSDSWDGSKSSQVLSCLSGI